MSLWNFLSFFGCGGNSKSAVETIEHPPFRIQKRAVVDRRFKPNEGTISKITFTRYNIFYQDQPIALPKALDAGSGVSGIWKAYFLKDAPTPTLLLGSVNVYYVTEENQAAKVSLIEKNHSDYATLQWLDSENGQPGRKMPMLIGKDTTDCTLEGGTLLLINKNTVLRVADLALFPFKVSIDFTDGYYTGDIVGFSPDKREIVFMGSKNHEINRTQFIHALLVYNYQTNEAYAVPFDNTETRLHDPYRLEPGWMDTYFEWQKEEEGQYILAKKTLPQLPNWEGHFTISSNYTLKPVTEEMHGVFLNFTKSFLQLNETDISPEEYGGLKQYNIKYKAFIFDITYLQDLSSVSFSTSFMSKGPEKEAKAIIEDVGKAFNEVLRKGEHQTLFTSY